MASSAAPSSSHRRRPQPQVLVKRLRVNGNIESQVDSERQSQKCFERDAAPMDHYSPVAPAHIRVLVLPVGQVESSRFSSFVRRLQSEASIVPLTEIEDRSTGDATSLSPKAFPQGSLLYRFSATAPSEEHEKISPYDFFREPLIILGVVDGLHNADNDSKKELAQATVYLRERHPRVVHRQLVLLKDGGEEGVTSISSAICVTNADEHDHASLRSAISELSARFLVEFATYAKAVQASPTIQTPGQTSLKRNSSLRESEKRPGSGHGDFSHTTSPTEDGRSSDSFSPGKRPPMPATSFDQMPSANQAGGNNRRRDSDTSTQSSRSKGRARSSSQDRVPTQGFGTSNAHGERFVATGFGQSSSQEKTRARGKARVGIVMGSIYMMSGQWREALRHLTESTTISNALTDHLWHAKGLENMLVCMMLLLWSSTEFKISKLCDLASDKASASKFSRNSANPPGVPRESAESAKDKSQGHRLSVVIPGLARKILSLLRSTEGSLELPFLVFAESSVRIAKVLAALNDANGELTPEWLQALVVSNKKAIRGPQTARSFIDISKPYSKTAIADILTQALPFNGDMLATSDQIRLLAGVASTFSVIGFDRKKAMVIKDAVARLTGALMQARKLGAAEMGIHPAASLSTDTGAETILAIAAEGSGLANLMADVSNTYGASTFSSSCTDSPIFVNTKTFGSSRMKFEILRALSGFCEAAPDPEGVLLMTASLLRAAGPNAAIDAAPEPVVNAFSREEQMHLATVISRTVGVSKHLGLPNVQAVYWDSFLVRGVEIMPPTGDRAIIPCTRAGASIEEMGPGNPLLYDPNASRPGTAVKQTSVLVHGEFSECIVTLQNPFDIPVDIENLSLVTDGMELESDHGHEPTTLGPLRIQQVSLKVKAHSVGATKITGCRIKMQGCVPQVFPIVIKPWRASHPITTKNLGLDARPNHEITDIEHSLKILSIEAANVPVTVIEAIPMLVMSISPDMDFSSTILEGERLPMALRLRNTSNVHASVFDVADSAQVLKHERDDADLSSADSRMNARKFAEGVLRLPPNETPMDDLIESLDPSETVVPPGGSRSFNLRARGRTGVTMTKVSFYYCASGRNSKYARVTSHMLEMTVYAALHVRDLQITPSLEDPANMIDVSVDIRNGWHWPVSYQCQVNGNDQLAGEGLTARGSLIPGEMRRVYQTMPSPSGKSRHEEDDEKTSERFFSYFQVRWASRDERTGAADLRRLTLSKESLEVLRGPLVEIAVSVVDHEESSNIQVEVMDPIHIRAEVSNRGQRSAPLCVELRDSKNTNVPLDYWYIVAGSLKQLLPPLEESAQQIVDFVLYPRFAGSIDLEVKLGQLSDAPDRISWLAASSLSMNVIEEKEADAEDVDKSKA